MKKNQLQLFREKNRRNIWIKAAIIGLSAAALISGVLLLTAKNTGISELNALWGMLALPIGTGLFLLFRRSSEKKFAKKLDDDFDLHEKVQTMIEFSAATDELATMQREDAMAKLTAIPTSKMKFTHLWLYILLPVMACAMVCTAVACPSWEEPGEIDPGYVTPPRDISDWEWAALDDLMEYVKNSEADASHMKPQTYNALNDLRNLLLKGVSESSLPVFVNTTVTQINNIKTDANDEAKGLTARQKEINEEVCTYTVNTLCEIFGLAAPQEPDDTKDPNTGDDPKDPNGSGGTGDVSMGADDKLFDSLQGYIAYPNVIGDYYSEINKAFKEGVLSEEYYDYLMTYFRYLYGSETEQ